MSDKIVPGVLVSIQGKIKLANKKTYTGDHEDEIAKVVSIDGELATIILEESEKKKATTWVGNLEYYCESSKYDIGDLITLVPLKIIHLEYEDGNVRYEIQVGDDKYNTFTVDEKLISQVLSKE